LGSDQQNFLATKSKTARTNKDAGCVRLITQQF